MYQLFIDDRIICIILFLRKNEVSQKSLNNRTVHVCSMQSQFSVLFIQFPKIVFHNIVMLSVFVNNQTGSSRRFIQFPKIFFSQRSDAFSVYQQPCT